MIRSHHSGSFHISEEDVRRQLKRILDCSDLQSSTRRREMLRHVVEETLAGRDAELKATTIAMAVFGRGSDFDQQSDPIVRLEARKLRRDLDNYYAGHGRDDPIRISIPKGHYIPKFSQQEQAVPNEVSLGEKSADDHVRELKPGNKLFAGAAFVVVVCIAITLGLGFLFARPENLTPTEAPSVSSKISILVEEFEPRTNDDFVSLVASGLTNEIAAALIRFPDLAVHIASKQATTEAETTSSDSNAPETEFKVTGDVWREGEELLFRTNLVRRTDFEILWSERYAEGTYGQSITAIQDTISSQIASTIGQQYGYVLSDVRANKLEDHDDPSLRGFACVASAQIYRRTYHRDQYQAARDCLEATVREEPEYVRAWAMLAYLRNDAARFGHETELSRDAAFALAKEAAIRAIDLNPQDTDALQAMSHVEQYAGDMARSIEFARKAVEANPNDPAALANLAIRYGIAGRFPEGVPIMHRAIDLSVAPPPFYFHLLAADHLIKEEWEELVIDAERASADGWSFGQALLAIAHSKLSNEPAARVALTRLAELDPLLSDNPKAWLESHSMHAVLVEAVTEGLSEAHAYVGG